MDEFGAGVDEDGAVSGGGNVFFPHVIDGVEGEVPVRGADKRAVRLARVGVPGDTEVRGWRVVLRIENLAVALSVPETLGHEEFHAVFEFLPIAHSSLIGLLASP